MEKSTRRLVFAFVGLAVLGLAGSAAAASLVAPQAPVTTTAYGNAVLGADGGANPGVHIASPPPAPTHNSGGCHHGWWG